MCKFTLQSKSFKSIIIKLRKTFGLQQKFSKKELDHWKINEDTWEKLREEWIPYIKWKILSLTFVYARYTMFMSKITGFGKKYCLSPPSLGWKFFNSVGLKNLFIHTQVKVWDFLGVRA